MAHRLIGKAQRWIHPAIAVADQGVIQGTALDQTSGQELLHLLLEAEGAGRSDLIHKSLRRELEAEQLPADRRLGKLDGRPQPQTIGGEGGGKALAVLQGDRRLQSVLRRSGA
jgi:hypothetical protein